ncbi:MAG: fasciclin domain-containing protein [Saprospiraceae bacterium]|nr:fasciclin domain-containing protein [Bacteroidia bacterium]NNE16799.1 fasciclin domain-containing protein [Saprospiraceae bacterium]NNL92868.1 fasciclin domain-containing protein [Saprospiraceae bacterium]
MKIFSTLIFGLFIMSSLSLTSCGDDDNDQPKTIVDTAIETDNLSILVEALTKANLVSTLQGDGPFTVFAPTNDAFQALLDSNPDWDSLDDIDNATLTEVLKFHVISGNVMASDLTDTYVTSLASGPNSKPISIQIDVTGGVKFNGSAAPVTTDISTSNGIVHIINEVMLPPSVVNIALNNSNFTSLVAALTRSDLTTDFVSILSGEGPFTIFAPTNEAFQVLLDSNSDWDSLNDIPVATLEAVLTYHVIAGANVQAAELTDNQSVEALGGSLVVDLSSGAKLETTSNQSVNIIITDVQGSNGVVHAVDTVLLP